MMFDMDVRAGPGQVMKWGVLAGIRKNESTGLTTNYVEDSTSDIQQFFPNARQHGLKIFAMSNPCLWNPK